MKIHADGNTLTLIREETDPIFRDGGWGTAESRLLHHAKKRLQAAGFDVVKRRLHADGHMMGDARSQYIRERKHRFYVYDGNWQIRDAAEEFNREGKVTLFVRFNGGETE
jgi:hypothetical protein